MPNIVQSVPPCKIVDTDIRLNPVVLGQVEAAGYAGVARYVPLPGDGAANDIRADELGAVMEAGLGLLLVQHVRFPHWDPAMHSGGTDARVAVQFAMEVGYLAGAHIFLDLEGIVPGTGTATKAFAEAWAATVVGAGYRAGCYVGFDVPLTPQELFDLHDINSYWSDAGPRNVAVRGFAIKQHPQIQIAGVNFDPDTVQPDLKGETPVWMASAPRDIA
jgi:glycoside hydrolase-like protein